MIYEYAISPDMCQDYKSLCILLNLFGKAEGRIFSDIPRKKWKRWALKVIKNSNNKQVEKKRLSVTIDRLVRKAMYCRNFTPFSESDDWLEHAIKANHDRPFQAIIAPCNEGSDSCVITDDDMIDDMKWQIPFDLEVNRTAEEMIGAIKPMLNMAREIILIDRNFDPDKYRWSQFLVKLVDEISHRAFSPRINRVDFHIGDKINSNHLELMCNKNIKKNLPASSKLNFFIWPKDDLHDRFVLTDVGGVEFGIGLDVFDGGGPKEVKISRISEITWGKWWKLCKNYEIAFSI
jgi:hypothetical protein